MRQALALVGVLAVALLGCKAVERLTSGSAASGAPATSAAPAQAAAAPPPPAEAEIVSKNPRVVELVDNIRLYCHFSAKGVFDRCQGDPARRGARVAGTDLLNDPTFVETISVMLLEGKNPRLTLASAELLEASTFHVYNGLSPLKNPKASSFVSRATADRLLKALRTVPQARRAVVPIVWIASAQSLTQEVVDVLKKLPSGTTDAAQARRHGMASLLDFGGLPAFEQLKAFAAGGSQDDAEAAASAPAGIRQPNPADVAVICPWLKELLTGKDDGVASSAAHSILYICHNDFPAILKNFERRVEAVTVSQRTLMPFHTVCRAPDPDAKPPPEDASKPLKATDEQCAAMFSLVQKVVDDKRFDQIAREISFGILSRRADDETLRVCTAWKDKKRSEDFRIPEAASKCVKRVREAMLEKARAGK